MIRLQWRGFSRKGNLMKTLPIIALSLLIAAPTAWGFTGDFICSYIAHISPRDKVNSAGKTLIHGYTKETAIAILRQDRANYHQFNKRDKFDTADCQMHTVSGRNQFESALRQNTISANGIKMMIDSNPILEIQIYQNDLKVRVIQK